MKNLMFGLFALSLAIPALADTPVIRAKKVTCQELQDAVRNYGAVTVTTKPFLFLKRLDVSQEIECGSSLVKRQAFFNTSDMNDCAAGVYCASRPIVIDHDHRRPDHRPTRVERRPSHRPPRIEHRPSPRPPRVERPTPRPPRVERPTPRPPRVERPTRPSDSRPTRPQRERPSGPRREGGSRVCRGGACS